MNPGASDLTSIHKALIGFNKRAERASGEILEATFVDSAPLFELLSTTNNQVIYGRRGTGKTHALRYLASDVERRGEKTSYVDLRSVGSNGSIYVDSSRGLADRASILIADVLKALMDEMYALAVIALETSHHPDQITSRLDDVADAISSVRVTGSTEVTTESIDSRSSSLSGAAEIGGKPIGLNLALSAQAKSSTEEGERRTARVSGIETVHLNFGSIGSSIASLLAVCGIPRLWLLIDEWSEVPIDLQPYLADLFRRTLLPINAITIKIAAIEHRSHFAIRGDRGSYVGLELGADVAADLNLDDFLVFDNNQDKSTDFFKTLLFRHYQNSEEAVPGIHSADQLVQTAFTQWPVFQEFVRAVEGVPRDALNLAAKMATKAYGQRIAMHHVRNSARDWYQADKQAAVRGNSDLNDLLLRIIDDIIGKRKARAFLFPSNYRDPRIEQLFDARLLHVLKKNVSSRDEPGVRYDVYKIDFGCYVDLANTTQAPAGLFFDEDEGDYIEVPKDDYRSIRRAILRPSEMDQPLS